jgi:signal transduction histidine kinase
MRRRPLSPLSLAAAATVLVAASLTAAGDALALAVCIPVLLGASLERRRDLSALAALVIGGFAAATSLLHLAGGTAWTGMRLLALAALVVSAGVALLLQATRAEVVADRRDARAASDVNRLLVSLLAHDLRSPLVLADQGLQYVEESVAGGYPIDRSLVADLRARLQRSLRAIGLVLDLARDEDSPSRSPAARTATVALFDEIGAEVESFRYEAEVRGKRLVVEADGVPVDPVCDVDVLVLRQTLAIALDNAVRYADPGTIRVRADVVDTTLQLRVEDPGPGLSVHRADEDRARGSGLGLRLCSALLARAGGSLVVEDDSPAGTAVAIRLPVSLRSSAAPHSQTVPAAV